ncbi:MAG: FHA domain-containing protein, partial [Gammaproteobacteria bacterium]
EFRAAALPAMFRIHQNLADLVQQLGTLDEAIDATITIPGVGTVEGFRQRHHALEADGMPPETVTLRCELRQRREQVLEITTAGLDVNAWVDRLRRHGVLARVVHDGDNAGALRKSRIALQGSIPVVLRFSLDAEHGVLQLHTQNFEEIGERRQVFNPAVVTEQWCDEMLKFVLRRDNRFLRDELPAEMRERLRQRIEWERTHGRSEPAADERSLGLGAMLRIIGRKPGAPPSLDTPRSEAAPGHDVPEESAANRVAPSDTVRKLLKARPPLVLECAGQRIDLARHSGACVIGRAQDCDLVVAEKHVSKVHARVEFVDGDYVIVDCSRNGTFVYFDDGTVHRLREESAALRGSGRIALGTRPSTDENNVIRFGP